MNFFRALDISASGLSAQRLRLDIVAANLANAGTTRTPSGGPYRRQDVVFEAVEVDRFRDLLRGELATPAAATGEQLGVRVSEVVTDPSPPRMVYDPGHPHANPEGYVAYPNVNPLEEMVNLLDATRAYEANVTAVQAAKSMAMRALEIGL